MKLHRFYTGQLHDKRGHTELTDHIWVHDQHLLNQWLKVLRFREGDELSLFDGSGIEKLYKVAVIEPLSVKLELVTELHKSLPTRHRYLLWSLLKADKNDLVIQKATEIGITNFVPLVAARTEKTGFDEQRAMRIAIEAAEQCGRVDIPHIREPILVAEAIKEYTSNIQLLVAEQGNLSMTQDQSSEEEHPIGVLIGPEGGWTDEELQLFSDNKLAHIGLGAYTLRAETAAITAAAQLLQ